jgi:hypothetical protein
MRDESNVTFEADCTPLLLGHGREKDIDQTNLVREEMNFFRTEIKHISQGSSG